MPKKVKAAGRSVSDFLNNHDKRTIVPKQIRAALVTLGNSWEYEGEFVKRAALSQTEIAQFRDQFKDHVVETSATKSRPKRRVWAGTKAFAEKLRAHLQ